MRESVRAAMEAVARRLVVERVTPGFALCCSFGEDEFACMGGFADVEERRRATADTVFATYSLTKPVVALAALRLAEKGLLQLEGKVADYLPGWVDAPVAPWESPSDVRVMHLLAHTAGFTYGSRCDAVAESYRRSGFLRAPPSRLAGKQLYSTFSRLPRIGSPGSAFNYSLASDVLGWVLAEVAKTSLGSLLRTEVFEPVGMRRSSLLVDLDVRTVAPVYGRGSDGGWARADELIEMWGDQATGSSGGAGLASTASDYLRFAGLLTRRPLDYLSRSSWAELDRNRIPGGLDLASSGFSRNVRATDGVGFGFGMAIAIDGPGPDNPSASGELGWEGATGCLFLSHPTRQVALALMTNAYPNGTRDFWGQARRILYDDD